MAELSRRKAAIKRATRNAQRRMNRLDAEMLDDLRRLYEQAVRDLSQRIQSLANPEGNLGTAVLGRLRAQIERRLEALSAARDELLSSGLSQGAALGVAPMESALSAAALSEVADGAVRAVWQFVDDNGLQLSDRLWRIDRHAREAVSQAVESAVVQGASASRAAMEFLSRGQPVPADLQQKMGQASADRVSRLPGRALLRNPDDRTAYENARRVFRTEINRAHGIAYEESAMQHPDAVGTRFLLSPRHPRRDICDMHASVNRYGLGPGVYPEGKNPWPAHPNTLSYKEVVFRDEVTEADKAGKQDRISWLKAQPPAIQEAVLNSRRKRGALQQGILTEGQIATPWKQLKERYRQQGVDLDSLTPAPIQALAYRHRGQPMTQADAERYVLEEGRRDGVEYALVWDERTGQELFRKTSRQRKAVYFDSQQARLLREEERNLQVMHNHPSSSSLSGADFALSTLPGVRRVVAAGHDGSIYAGRATVTGRSEMKRIWSRATTAARRVLGQLVDEGMDVAVANRIWTHLVSRTLARRGLVEYEVQRVGEQLARALERAGDIEDIVRRIAEEVQ